MRSRCPAAGGACVPLHHHAIEAGGREPEDNVRRVNTMAGTSRYVKRRSAGLLTWGRSVLAGAILLGLFAMHGLTMADTTHDAIRGSRHVTAMTASVVITPAAHAVHGMIAEARTGHPIPMPIPGGGHGSHDLLHTCLAVLTALAGLALLAAALAITGRPVGGVAALGGDAARRRHRTRPRPASIVELCISRT